MSHIKTFDPKTVTDCRPYYSPLSTIQGPVKFIYTAGQVGRDREGKVPASYEKQVKLAFQNLDDCLNAGGASRLDIVKLTYYIVNYNAENRPHANILLDYLKGHRPPSTLIPVQALAKPEYLFEIEAVAAVRDLRAIPPVVKPNPGASLKVDVVVVGAGLSGLQAAHDLQRAGLSCIVLEARDRVGGKTWSQPTKSGSFVDLGAAWINDSNQSKMYALAKRFDLDLIEQLVDGNCVAHAPEKGTPIKFRYGEVPNFSAEDTKNIVKIRDLVEELCHTIDITSPYGSQYDAVTFEKFVKRQGAGEVALGTVSVWTRAMLGCEPSEVSALYFLDYCKSGGGLLRMRSDQKDGGQHLRIKKGTQTFSIKIAESMIPDSIILEASVSRISQNRSGATVTTEDGAIYHSKKVIVSVPTPSYKNISFSPPLPLDKVKYSSGTILGYYAKMILVWEKQWWRDIGLCGMSQSFVGPFSVTRDTSDSSLGQFSLTCFITGEPGRKWSKLNSDDRKAAVLSQLVDVFGAENEEAIRAPLEVFEHEWVKDAWSQGCPCPFTPPNLMNDVGASLRAPFKAVHFVGTETSFEWKGYMEGAVRSGERGAVEVIQALGSEEFKNSARL